MKNTLGFKIVVPLFAIAGLSMGNQSCEQAESARVLKMDVELGTLKGRVVKLPNGTSIDFPYVANSLFYRQVIIHDHFVIGNPVPTSLTLANSAGVFKTQKANEAAAQDAAPSGLVSAKDISVLDTYGMLKRTRTDGAAILKGTKTVEEVVVGKATNTAVTALPACLYEMPQAKLGGEIISFEATWRRPWHRLQRWWRTRKQRRRKRRFQIE